METEFEKLFGLVYFSEPYERFFLGASYEGTNVFSNNAFFGNSSCSNSKYKILLDQNSSLINSTSQDSVGFGKGSSDKS